MCYDYNRIEENRIEHRRVGTTVTHALGPLSIFCAALKLVNSAFLHLEQSAVSGSEMSSKSPGFIK
jgi:hypothetical protein